jgi:hypothetical protein
MAGAAAAVVVAAAVAPLATRGGVVAHVAGAHAGGQLRVGHRAAVAPATQAAHGQTAWSASFRTQVTTRPKASRAVCPWRRLRGRRAARGGVMRPGVPGVALRAVGVRPFRIVWKAHLYRKPHVSLAATSGMNIGYLTKLAMAPVLSMKGPTSMGLPVVMVVSTSARRPGSAGTGAAPTGPPEKSSVQCLRVLVCAVGSGCGGRRVRWAGAVAVAGGSPPRRSRGGTTWVRGTRRRGRRMR